jgi:hypothetical protein
MMVRCFVLYIPLLISGLFSANNPNGRPYVDVEWGWVVGAVLQLIVILILLDATRLALKRKNFVDRVIEKGMAH